MQYDIFISYKRKSLPTANNLYYRLTTRGYSTFFDLEEMGRDNFNVQLLSYIENAKDVFVILEEGSLDACRQNNWEKDWFCREIAYALEKKKNIIPILIGGYQMPSSDYFPAKLKELSFKNAPEFNFSFFEAYLDKLMEKEYLLSKPNLQENATSVFKFYSNETCQVFKEGKLVCSLEGMSDAPYYLPVPRKGDYRFKAVNISTADEQQLKEHIDSDEEKEIEISWKPQKVNIIESEKCKGEDFELKLEYSKDDFKLLVQRGNTGTFDQSFVLPIEDTYPIEGRGIVVTGRIESGNVKVGEVLVLVGYGNNKSVQCQGIEMKGKMWDKAFVGDEVGLLLGGLKKEDIAVGQVVAQPYCLSESKTFNCDCFFFESNRGVDFDYEISRSQPLQFYIRTANVWGRLDFAKGVKRLKSGDYLPVKAILQESVPLNRGLVFAIRMEGTTIGVGIVTAVLLSCNAGEQR